MKLSVPSKTYIVGEYGVLAGGPALLLNTEPTFDYDTQTKVLTDPHLGKGGFGASSAKWIFESLESLPSKKAHEIVQAYRKEAWSGEGSPPSGVDILSQLTGRVAWVDIENEKLSTETWPFEDLSFAIVRTGVKVPTHEHLKELEGEGFSELIAITQKVMTAFQENNQNQFLEGVREFSSQIKEQGLLAPGTNALLHTYENELPILASKGCGALGADTALLLFKTQDKENVLKKLADVIATEDDLLKGLTL